jgi:hypothetical protein
MKLVCAVEEVAAAIISYMTKKFIVHAHHSVNNAA